MDDRFAPDGSLRRTVRSRGRDAVAEAEARAARNRERGETGSQGRMEEPVLHYPWQRESFLHWQAGRAGLVALSLGLPEGDLPWAAMADVVNGNPSANVLVITAPDQRDTVRQTLDERFGRHATTLDDHHFLEPRGDGVLLVADTEELATADLPRWGRFATNALLLVLDADGVGPHLGQQLLETPFTARLCISRLPSSIDLLLARPWARGFGPLLYRYTEDQARDLGVLPRIHYRLHVEMLKPEPGEAQGPEGPWDPADIPTRIGVVRAGQFAKGRARDVAIGRAKETPNLVVIQDGVPIPGATTLPLRELPSSYEEPPAGWILATPDEDRRAIYRIATAAWKTLKAPGLVEDVVVLPVPKDLCRVAPWTEPWRQAAVQIDRVAAGLLLAEEPEKALTADDLEALVGVALALRGIPAEDLYAITPVVAEAAEVAYSGGKVPPERVRDVSRSYGGLAAAVLVAAEAGPMALLRIAHPRFTPGVPDLPHPSIYDAKAHAWRGRAFKALAESIGKDMVTAWGRYPELRFVFPSSSLLEAATAYCKRHKLKSPLHKMELNAILPRTRILDGSEPELGPSRTDARAVLKEWNDALELAEKQERDFLADMHARQPERERRREGTALPGLRVVDSGPDHVTLETDGGRFPATNISPGSEVSLVERGDRRELARGNVSRLTPRRVTIEFYGDAPPRNWPRFVTVNLTFDAKVFEAYHAAVLAAVRSVDTQSVKDDSPDGLLRATLLGETPSGKQAPQTFDEESLTQSQRESIENVLSGGRVHLVHGPPGTGKTHTLVRMAMALSQAGHSVLVTADSNAAVDNMVVGLRRNGALVVRVAHAPNLRDAAAEPARIDPLEAPPFVRWAADQGIVVATTNYGAFRYLDAKGSVSPFTFDYVVHDEAGQSTAPSSLAAVMRGRRLVLAGDPLQLPPTVVSLDAKEAGLDVTLFERIQELTGKDRTTLLRTQFRMREPICSFSNKRYYEGQIETAPSAAAQDGLPDVPAVAFQHVTGKENPRQRNGSISNNYEVDCIRHLLETYRSQAREKGWTMAVLTPYQAQRELFRRHLPDIEVSTVDGAQGREWDIVFYSSVRSNPRHRLGFVSDERRLNVAVTRARRNFILVGDERTLREHGGFSDLLDVSQKIRMFYPDRHATDLSLGGARGQGAPKAIGANVAPKKRRRGRRGGRKHREGRDEGGSEGPSNRGRDGRGGRDAPKDRGSRDAKGGRGERKRGDGERPREAEARRDGQGASAGEGHKRGRRGRGSGPHDGSPEGADAGPRPRREQEDRPKREPKADAPSGCAATTQKGTPCRNKAKPGSRFCGRHS